MTFREKSAWAMSALTLVTGLAYLRAVAAVPADAPPLAQIGPLAIITFWVVIGSVAVQTVLAVMAPSEAQRPADERERPLIDKAGHWSAYVLTGAVLVGAFRFLLNGNGVELFQWAMGGLIASQLAEYALQIVLFRRGS